MTIKLHPIRLGVLIAGLLLLLFLLIRGCWESNSRILQASILKAQLDSLSKKQITDSITAQQNQENYNNSLDYANGLLDLRQNKLDATEALLLTATFELSDLRKKYESIKPDYDTSVTLVPNPFIEDCKDCFDNLEYQKRLVGLYIGEVRDIDSAHRAKEKLQENRICELTSERNTFLKNANDAIEIAGKAQGALKPGRKVFLSLGVLWAPLPRAVGGGFIYQDKRNRQFGARAYVSRFGPFGETEVNLPLSFKRKKL